MILIHFTKGGRVTIKPHGYPGTMCKAATKPYEDAMKGDRTTVDGEENVTMGVTATEKIQQHG